MVHDHSSKGRGFRPPAALAASLVLILVCAACGTSSASPSGTALAPASAAVSPGASVAAASPSASFPTEPVTLTMWVTADGTSKKTFDGYAAEYKKIHPNVDVQIEEFPFLDLHDKLSVALQAGTGAPDLAVPEISRFGSLLKGDIGLVDLTDKIAATGVQLVQARQNNYTYQGRAYGIEFDVDPVQLFYREDIFTKAGITTPIATWADYVAAGKLLKEKTGKSMMAIETTDYDVWTPIMLQFGCDFFDPDGKVTLDSPECHKAFNFLVGLVQTDKIAIAAPGGDQYNPTFWGAYGKGDVASIWGASWMLSILEGFVPDLAGKWKAQNLPSSPDAPWNTSTVGGNAIAITKQAKNVDVAWDFARYLGIDKPLPKNLYSVPNNQKWWGDAQFQQPRDYLGGQVIGQLWLDQANELLKPGAPYLNPNPDNPTAYDIFTRTALGPAISGDKGADEALTAAAAELTSTVGQ